ncbi:MAG: hypothetical protein GWN00_39195, partial [Aliifodinibius sp.]|nr:hypothetical protein [Fodinibius sp.]NIY30591.1 hypothetical protein [Fodinibius sp.]
DLACLQSIPRKAVQVGETTVMAWVLDFGFLDIGKEKTSHFFIRNETVDLIADLGIRVNPPSKPEVDVRLVSPSTIEWFPIEQPHEVIIHWRATDPTVKAGRCRALISIDGYITREE